MDVQQDAGRPPIGAYPSGGPRVEDPRPLIEIADQAMTVAVDHRPGLEKVVAELGMTGADRIMLMTVQETDEPGR